MAQNWPKCKIHRKNGGCGAVLIMCLLQHKLSMSWLLGGVFLNLQANSRLKQEDIKSNHQITHNNQLTNESKIEMQ